MTDKLSPTCVDFYSESLWTAIQMGEVGVCMDRRALLLLEEALVARCLRCHTACAARGLPLEGKGSSAAKDELVAQAAQVVAHMYPNEDIYGQLELTQKKKKISFKDVNRNYLLSKLPRRCQPAQLLRLAGAHSKAQKLISSYVYPLLHHQRTNKKKKHSILLPYRQAHIAFPQWYVTPSPFKDDSGGEGGTKLSRITVKNPGIQTFPSIVKKCIISRFRGGCIASADLSQIELRIAGLLSGEPAIIGVYNDPTRNLHRETASQVFARPEAECQSGTPWYRAGKHVNFGELFLATAPTLHDTVMRLANLDLPMEIFEEIETSRRHRRPMLFEWQTSLALEVERQGYLEIEPIGQSRWYVNFKLSRSALHRGILADEVRHPGDPKRIHEIVNQPIQTTAGNVGLAIQHELRRRLPDPHSPRAWCLMTHQVYDSFVFDLRSPEDLPNLENTIRDAVDHVQNEGFWAGLCDRTGSRVPLCYEMEYPEGHAP